MKAKNLVKALCTVGVATVFAMSIVGCTEEKPVEATEDPTVIAVTVNGVEIPESKITNYIENMRAVSGLDTEDAWGQWLAENDYTPESIREEIIGYFADQELIKQAAAENGITADSAEVDEKVSEMKAKYASEEKWQDALKTSGTTEAEYRAMVENGLVLQHLREVVAVPQDVTEDELVQYAQMYASAYNNAKRSSHILFNSTDEAQAKEVLAKIKAGEITFEDAVAQYSTDTSTIETGGDMGWDVMGGLDQDYTAALANLEKDQISDLVISSYGIHIIKCTDVFVAPEEVTSSSQVPAEFIASIKASLEKNKKDEAYSAWYTSYKEAADIVINPMPEDVPYAVDMSKYQTEDESADAAADGAVAGDGTVTDGADATPDESAVEEPAAEESAQDGSAAEDPAEEGQPQVFGDSTNEQPAEAA